MITFQGVEHRYSASFVLPLPDLHVNQGQHTLIQGLSGSGKSTMLHIIGGVLRPEKGSVTVAGVDLKSLKGDKLDRFRGRHIGIVFQQMHLLATLTVAQNIQMATFLAGNKQDGKQLQQVLSDLDLLDKADNYPRELSQGQKQRVCIARAVINQPELILADEPTSSLDDQRCTQVLELLIAQAEKHNATLLIATHDQRIKPHFTHHLFLDEVPAAISSAEGAALTS
ncbi:MAG: ATP-binding cassette domain-containing protein [Bacteroidota bacterium]